MSTLLREEPFALAEAASVEGSIHDYRLRSDVYRPPNLEETEVDAKVEQIAEGLRTSGGEPGEIEKMGKRRLAYEINDIREGYYVVMKFKSDAAAAKELERQLRLNEDVMRQLLINLNAD